MHERVYAHPFHPAPKLKAKMNANEAKATADFWRQTAWSALKDARAAEAAATATSDSDARAQLVAAANAALQAASAAEVARQQADANEKEKNAQVVAAQTTVECGLTQGKSVDCLMGQWKSTFDDCNEEAACDAGGAVVL